MDRTFAEWLYSHLMMFKESASGHVNLSFNTLEFEGTAYTLAEAIDKAIEWSLFYLKNDDPDKGEDAIETLQRATRLWAEILPFAWW